MAHRNFVPQVDGSGSIGTLDKSWYSGSFKHLYVSGTIINTALSASLAAIETKASASADTASFAHTASWAETASFATTASYSATGTSASYAVSASSVRAEGVQPGSFPVGTYTFPYESNVNIDGTLTVTTLIAEYVTQSHEYITGSTKWGDELTDTHEITGSLDITGSFRFNGSTTYPSASWAETASYAHTASWAETGSYATTASWAETSSYSATGLSASYAVTSSYTTMFEYDVNGDMMIRDS